MKFATILLVMIQKDCNQKKLKALYKKSKDVELTSDELDEIYILEKIIEAQKQRLLDLNDTNLN